MLTLQGGARRLANIHKLLRLAADFERDRGRDVRGLADLATAELEAEARETDAPVELGDVKAVRLMSVHAAKGLEFPVVCIADLGRQRPADGDEDLLVAEGEVGLRLVGLDGSSQPALAYERLRDRARGRAAREEERVMYVALTRARERLIVSGGVPLANWPGEGPKAPPLAWLGPALLGGDLRALPTSDEPVRGHRLGRRLGALRGQRARHRRPRAARRVARARRHPPAGRGAARAAPAGARAARRAAGQPHAVVLAAGRLEGVRLSLLRPARARPARGGPAGRPAAADPRRRCGEPAPAEPRRPPASTPARAARSSTRCSSTPARTPVELAGAWGIELTAEEAADVVRLTEAFNDSPLARRMAKARAVHREHGFTVPLGDTLLTGIVDVLVQERGGQLVVDYKTDALHPATDLAAYVEQRYGVQRRVYALAALRGGAPRVEVAYAFLERPAEPVGERFEAADADRLEAELGALAAGLLAGDYPVTATPHRELCETCPARRALCSYGEEMTLRPLGASVRW